MLNIRRYPFQKQLDLMDCAPACLKMIAEYHGIRTSVPLLRDLCNTSRLGTSTADIVYAAEKTGLNAAVFKTTVDYLAAEQPLPCILHWRNNHYVVLYRINKGRFTLGDPGHGIVVLPEEEFVAQWVGNNKEKGIAIFLEPALGYGGSDPDGGDSGRGLLRHFRDYLRPHVRSLGFLLLTIVLASLISLLVPRTIQYMMDRGVAKKNIPVIWQMLGFQFALFAGLTLTNYVKSFVQTKLSTKLSIGIISHFLLKLLRLPISFFDTKNHADLYQRIADHSRIEAFLSTKMVSFVFSFSLLGVYVLQLFWFDKYVVISFLSFTAISFGWFLLFMNKRKELDYRRFGLAVEERYFMNDLISGMTEIKINNAQQVRVDKWHVLQQRLYGFKLSTLKLLNIQQNGTGMVNQLRNIFITFLCAYWVVQGKISFGVMLSIGYITGQLAIPLQDILLFFQDVQDARISFERLNEIQEKDDENNGDKAPFWFGQGFGVDDVWFKYPGVHNSFVLKQISLFIPKGKITAIVGSSGSGKTTLLKLLLAFYMPTKGEIQADGISLRDVNTDELRNQCGVVMQDAYIYNASIAENIALADAVVDIGRVYHALKMACLDEFVESLPLKHDTMLGNAGVDLSGGQKQRLFIARAVYKNPAIILLDEATNSLDSNNERAIMENLSQFFVGRTVIVIAHRLSTVKNADRIVVLEKGEIVEVGTHAELTRKAGKYYELVRNQLELG